MKDNETNHSQANGLLRDRRERCEKELSRLLNDILAIRPTVTELDLDVFDQVAPGLPTNEGSFAWDVAALSLEDKAIQLAEGWLDEPTLDPERLQQLVDFLSEVPGYWALRGLDGELLEQVARRLHDPGPRPISTKLRFVLGVLSLAESQEDRDKVLVA